MLISHSIDTQRLRIRLLDEKDLPALIPILSDPLVTQYLPFGPWTSDSDAQAWLQTTNERTKDGQAAQYIVEKRADGQIIGTCIAFNYVPKNGDTQTASADFGYVLGQPYWRNGYMFEAMTVFADQLVKELELSYLYAMVDRPNIASICLLKKLGFTNTTSIADDAELLRFQKYFATSFTS